MPFDPNDPDTKAAIDKIKADADAKLDSEVSGLKTKVEELIASNKKLKKGQEIDPAEVERLEAQLDEARGKLKEAEKAAKDATKAAETATKALEVEQGVTHRELGRNGATKALIDAGVSDPAYIEAALAMHMPNIKIVADGENRSALYGDKPLADAIKEWAAGDVGKKFVSAPNNSGGGAGGGGGQGGGKTMTRTAYQELATSEPAKANTFIREGGKVVDQAA